jgi:hypothetical protein
MTTAPTNLAVATTLEGALDPEWLTQALAPIGKGARVTEVERVEFIKTVATKQRFTVKFEGSDEVHSLCLKSILDVENPAMAGGSTTVLEADFYRQISAKVGVRVPTLVSAVIDREAPLGVIIMRDLIAEGTRFCSALEAFTPDQTAQSLEQLAELHAGKALLGEFDWIKPRVAQLAAMTYITPETLQEMMDGPRGRNLSTEIKDARRLVSGLKELSSRDAGYEQFLVHGDAHAGNIFRTKDGGTGIIDWQLLQSGGWALDVAYHTCATLPFEVAEVEERKLLGHYLGVMKAKGFAMPDEEEAWRRYREAAIYGYYLWAITRRVDPPIIEQFVDRLGRAVTRLESHKLLGIA